MTRTATWLTFGVVLIGTLLWSRLERRPREEPAIASAVEVSAEAEPSTSASAPGHATREDPQEPARTEASTEPVIPARRIPVRVLTRASHARDAAAVPGIAFRVFAQRARVEAPPSPLSVVPPLVTAPPHVPTDPVLHEGRTDETGTASFELDVAGLVLAEDGLPRLCARMVEPGHQQVTVGGWNADGVVQIHLVARKGASVRGQVVDEQGAFVEAGVRLRRMRVRSTAEEEEVFVFGPSATVLADGWFELHFDQRIDDGWLLAEAGARGTGTLQGLVLDPQEPPADLRIVVAGPGRIAGRVLDGDGEPAPGLDLLVQLAELDRPGPSRSLALAREAQGGGHVEQRLQTDAGGEFEVRGLRREPYVVRARIGHKEYGSYPVLLTPRAALADGQRLELVLHRPHVLVRAFDARGEPLALRGSKPVSFFSRSDPWPGEPQVLLQPCTPHGSEPLATGERLPGEHVGASEVLFEVPDGARYLVAGRGGGFDGTPRVVEVPEGANRVLVDLRAREPAAPGAIAVRVVKDDRELGRDERLSLVLESLEERVRLVELTDSLPTPPWVLSAPAGRYRLVVEGKPWNDFHHGTLMRPRAFGRAEAEVELRAGQTQELTLELDAGARLEVTLSGTPDVSDLAAVGVEGWFDPIDSFEGRASVKATLTLEQPGRRPEPLVFAGMAWEGTSAAGTHLLSLWPLGATQRSEVCPTGRYMLIARLPGGREVQREVELAPGTTTAVRLEF